MLDFLLDNFWLSLYIGLSQIFFVNHAAKNTKLTIVGIIALLILSPLWPIFLIILIIRMR